jgi:type I restriction enzyme S subunit
MTRSVPLGELISITRGITYKSALLGRPGPVLLGLASIARNGGFRVDSLRTYGGESPARLLVRPGELFASLKDVTQAADLLGSVARVPADGPLGRLTQDTVRIDVTSEAVDPAYLYLALLTPQYRAFCRSHATGTTNLGLPRDDFMAYEIPLPSLAEQHRIASVLDALDALIETERRNAKKAEELWHALVLSATGDGDKTCLSALASFVNGKNFTKAASGTGRAVIRTPEVRRGPGTSTVWNSVDAADENLASVGDMLFVWSGSLLVGRWLWGPALINQHIFKVMPSPDVPPWLAYWAIEELMEDFLGVAADKATTMGHIKRGDLDRLVACPARDRWADLDALIRPLWDESLQARVQAEALTRTRDELLPLLMSGRVRVHDMGQAA